MNTLASQMKLEFKLFLREKEALFWTLAFPVFMIVLFGLLWKDETWDGIPSIAYLLSGIIVMAVMTTCIVSTATGVVEEREKGIFRRLSLTPLKRQTLIGGQIVNRYLTVLAQTTILIAIGMAFFGAAIDGNLLLFWAVLTLGTISFLALGFALAALIKNEKSAHPLSMIVFFTLMFLGGCFFPIDQMPDYRSVAVHLIAEAAPDDLFQVSITMGWHWCVGRRQRNTAGPRKGLFICAPDGRRRLAELRGRRFRLFGTRACVRRYRARQAWSDWPLGCGRRRRRRYRFLPAARRWPLGCGRRRRRRYRFLPAARRWPLGRCPAADVQGQRAQQGHKDKAQRGPSIC